jgi:hypothetical protein
MSSDLPVAASEKGYCCTLMQDTKLHPIPAAPHRLRIRRRSMREETVEHLAVLDELIHRPTSNLSKACDNHFRIKIMIIFAFHDVPMLQNQLDPRRSLGQGRATRFWPMWWS